DYSCDTSETFHLFFLCAARWCFSRQCLLSSGHVFATEQDTSARQPTLPPGRPLHLVESYSWRHGVMPPRSRPPIPPPIIPPIMPPMAPAPPPPGRPAPPGCMEAIWMSMSALATSMIAVM